MNLYSLTLPDDPSEWGEWLNELLTNEDLVRTIAELKAITKGRTATPSRLSEIVSESEFEKLCSNGFGALNIEQCLQLIVQPELLLEIEERIIDAQPDYWIDKMSVASVPPFEEIRKRLPNFPEKVSLALKDRHAQSTQTGTTRRSFLTCLLYTSPSPRDRQKSRMPSSA